MSKSGGATRSSGSARTRAGVKAERTPEQAHADKVTKAEESVRKAEARVEQASQESRQAFTRANATHDTTERRRLERVGHAASDREFTARSALKTAKTRLENLRAANPHETPAQRAHETKSRQYEARIAKKSDELARLKVEYAAHQRGETVAPRQSRAAARRATETPMPKPIQTPGLTKTTPLHIVDPYDLRDTYGRDQLRNVLGHAGRDTLREAAGVVQERNPGTKPARANTNQGLIDYIDQYVP